MFFQNLFDQEFRGSLLAADRQYSLNSTLRPNVNRSDLMVAWNTEPYDLSVNTSLTVNYSLDFASPNFASLTINVAGGTASATKAYEVVNALNANAVFAALFTASVSKIGDLNTVLIKSSRPKTAIRAYISNTSAENALRFNKKAPVGELPSYFEKFSLGQAATYPDLPVGVLLKLNTADANDQAVITAAGFDYTSPKADWQLLYGANDAFHFTKNTYTGTNLMTSIYYPAGARVGDLAKKTTYTYDGSNNRLTAAEVPYILTSGDLITP